MAKKPRKTRIKTSNFKDWELDFMRNGPPDNWKESPHGFAYLDGYNIWQKLKDEPGFDPKDYPWAVWAYKNKE